MRLTAWVALTATATALVVSGACALICRSVSPPAGPVAPATPAPAVRGETKIATPAPATVQAYRPAVKRRINLPPEVADNPAQVVLDSARVAASDHDHTLTTLLDTETGDTITLAERHPLPWLAPETRGELGISYGLRDGLPMGRLSVRQNLLQARATRIGALATVDQDGQWYAGVGLWYRW